MLQVADLRFPFPFPLSLLSSLKLVSILMKLCNFMRFVSVLSRHVSNGIYVSNEGTCKLD